MKVEIWSDIACPFCYIGMKRFQEGLSKFPQAEQLEIIFRSFELDPQAERNISVNIHDVLASKYGMTREKAEEMNQGITAQAAALGLDFHMDTMKLTNTFDAHRMIHFAASHGKMSEMKEAIFKAYFTDSKHVGDHETLHSIAVELGLNSVAAREVLAGDHYAAEVRADEQSAAELGIRGVPYFVLDRKYAISGAQPPEVFLQALEKAWSEHEAN